ncbi:MAG: hypothetical protein RR387_03410 [Clostridiales bacterium]
MSNYDIGVVLLEKQKKCFGDRPDGMLIRDSDALHVFMPYILRNRADAEAFIQETIDLTAINAWLEQKNAQNPQYKYSFFQIISAAILKTVVLRPKLNRFIQGRRIYQRDHLSIAFVAKKLFDDDGEESLLMKRFEEDCTIDVVHDLIYQEVSKIRNGANDHSMEVINVLAKIPRPLLRIVSLLLRFLDYYGRVPQSIIKDEPNFASVFISNLGSIKLHAGYHHLNNWGTNSIFLVIGEKYQAPLYDDQGNVTMRQVLDVGITLDERIADGYYYAKIEYLLQHPQLLERPAREVVDYE